MMFSNNNTISSHNPDERYINLFESVLNGEIKQEKFIEIIKDFENNYSDMGIEYGTETAWNKCCEKYQINDMMDETYPESENQLINPHAWTHLQVSNEIKWAIKNGLKEEVKFELEKIGVEKDGINPSNYDKVGPIIKELNRDKSFNGYKHYVLGFLFSNDETKVLLINKNRPKFQVNKFNGIGGSVKVNETPLNAMIREFEEETGVNRKEWKLFADMIFENTKVIVHCYKMSSDVIYEAQTTTDEPISILNINNMGNYDLVDDVSTLLELCKSGFTYTKLIK